jgi:hypothetical protein
MKCLFSLVFVSVISLSAFAQTQLTEFVGKFEVKGGYGSGTMGDLSDVLRNLHSSIGLPGKIDQDYPASFYFGATLLFAARKWDFGVDYTFLTTEGKSHYEEGAEELIFENEIVTHSLGVVAQRRIAKTGPVSVHLSLTVSGYFTDMTIGEVAYVDGSFEDFKIEVRSRSVVATPMLVANIKLSRIFHAGVKAGYSFDSKGSMHLKGHEDAVVRNSNDDQIYTDWSGFRTEVVLGVLF